MEGLADFIDERFARGTLLSYLDGAPRPGE
jgi:hypothetical protein